LLHHSHNRKRKAVRQLHLEPFASGVIARRVKRLSRQRCDKFDRAKACELNCILTTFQDCTADPTTVRGAALASTLRVPMTWLGIALFFAYTGAEVATGQWVYSLLTEARGVPTAMAGIWVSLYWASLTLGRILFGFVVQSVSPTTLLRWCMAGAVLSALLIWVNGALWLAFAGIALMGLSLAPQFPLLISATPDYLGAAHASNGVGLQVAAASLGAQTAPPAAKPGEEITTMEKFQDVREVCGVGPADSTGKPRSSYWPGGRRVGACGRRPLKPRAMKGLSLVSSGMVDVYPEPSHRGRASCRGSRHRWSPRRPAGSNRW